MSDSALLQRSQYSAKLQNHVKEAHEKVAVGVPDVLVEYEKTVQSEPKYEQQRNESSNDVFVDDFVVVFIIWSSGFSDFS